MRRAVLQIDSEMSWRGGENQLRLLLENASPHAWQWHLAAPPTSEALKRLRSISQPVPLEMRGLKIFAAARRLAQYVDQHHIELVDCQSSRAHNLGLLLKYWRPQLRLVIHRRVDYPPGSSWFNRYKYLNARVDQYICISAAIADVLMRYGVPRQQISIVRSAVDPSPFMRAKTLASPLRDAWKLGPKTPVIGNVAYLTEQKDHGTLIRALGLLKRQGQTFFCFIAGTGPLEAAHKNLAREEGLGPENLQFLGVRDDIAALLAAADIFALSSADEGLGTSLLDAIYSDCALVATAVGGIPEVIIGEKTGLLAPPHQPGLFAKQLERLLNDAPLRQRLQGEALRHAEEHFSLRAMVDGNLAVYRSLLAT